MARENGAEFSKKSQATSDMDKLINDTKEGDRKSKSRKAKKNPTVNDLIDGGSDLGFAVPTGFILLHNDLQKLMEVVEKNGGGSSSVSTAASVVTAVASTVSAATDLVSALKSPAGLDGILDNDEVNAMLAKDPTIYDVRLTYTRAYVKAYYADLMHNMGYKYDEATGELKAEEGLDAAAGAFKGAVDIIAGSVGTAVASIGDAITNIAENAKLNEDEQVKAARVGGYRAYIKAYYASLLPALGYGVTLESMNSNTFELYEDKGNFEHILSVILGSVSKFIGDTVGNVANGITNANQLKELNDDPAVHKARVGGYTAYVKAYYASLLPSLGWGVKADNVNNGSFVLYKDSGNLEHIIKIMQDALGGLAGSVIDNLGKSVVNNIEEGQLGNDPEVLNARRGGYIAYIKAYYANLLESFGYHISTKNLNSGVFELEDATIGNGAIKSWISDIGNSIGSFLSGIFSGGGSNKATKGMQTMVENLFNSEYMDEETKGMMNGMAKTTYASLYTAFKKDVLDKISFGEPAREMIKGAFKNSMADYIESMTDIAEEEMLDSQSLKVAFDDSKVRWGISQVNSVLEEISGKLDEMSGRIGTTVVTGGGDSGVTAANMSYGDGSSPA